MSETPQHDAYAIYHKLDGEQIGYAFLSKSRRNNVAADLHFLPCTPSPTPTVIMEVEASKDADASATAPKKDKTKTGFIGEGHDYSLASPNRGPGDFSSSSISVTTDESKEIECVVKREFLDPKMISSSNLPDAKKMKFTDDCEKEKKLEHISQLEQDLSAPAFPSISTDFGHLNLPGANGWQRECVMSRGAVTMVYYLAPPDKQGNRRRLKSMKLCLEFSDPASQLTKMNFSFRKQVLGLQEGYEICRENQILNQERRASIYRDYFKHSKEGNGFVDCTLCGRTRSFTNFSTHMRKYHLPDETCPMCSLELDPTKMPAHLKTCRNTQNKVKIPRPIVEASGSGEASYRGYLKRVTNPPSSVVEHQTLHQKPSDPQPQPSTGPMNQDASDCSARPTKKAKIILRWSDPEPPSQATVEMQTDQPISKAIAKLAKRLCVSRNSLTCWVEEEKLTGSETAGELEGTVVSVVKKMEGK